jgi:hypothetical protein
VGGCGGNDNNSPSATSSFIRVFAEETTIAVDVSPTQVGIATTKLTFHGVDDVHEYHVMYARTDGRAGVPTPFTVTMDPTIFLRDGENLILQEAILLPRNAFSSPPLADLVDTDETLTLEALLDFFGEDTTGTPTTGRIILQFVCSDIK